MCGRIVMPRRQEESMDSFLEGLFGKVERESLKQKEAGARQETMARAATILRKRRLIREVRRSSDNVVVLFDCPSIVAGGECRPLELVAA